MRRVFLSFLGTNNYIPCNYLLGNLRIENIRFVQEANISYLCKDWDSNDQILICTTDESHDKNWLDNGHKDKEGLPITCEGLDTRLKRFDLFVPVEEIKIPSGKSEEEIWDIFDVIFQQLKNEDQLYLDITHAFRSLPMLAMVILNYAKVMSNVSVQSISYGAMEALGSVQDVKELGIEQRNVPVFDLLPFDQLQDWIIAVDRFTGSGDGKMIQRLADKNIRPILKETKGKHEDAAAIRNLGKSLVDFSSVIATCRGREFSVCANILRESLQKVQNQKLIKPLKPLLHKLEPVIAAFKGDETTDGIAAAHWCLDHDLYQQGYTILQETMITYILHLGAGKDGRDKDERTIVNQAVTILKKDLPEDKWEAPARDNKTITRLLIAWLHHQDDLLKCMGNISITRNDLNHAGQRDNAMSPDKISNQLRNYINEMEKIIERNRVTSSVD